MAKEVYGIDLGTTNSCIAVIGEDGLPKVLANSFGFYTTPSIVYYEEGGDITVGDDAKNAMQGDMSRTVAFIKRELGNPNYRREIDGEEVTPLKISAMILKKVVQDADAMRAEEGLAPIRDVVITVPAYFGNTEKELTRQAGEIAGLNVLQLIPEPTAAAYSYGINGFNGKTIMVYDLGGGTFDVSIMKIENGKFTELSNDGDHHLGGVDWDIQILNYGLEAAGLGLEYEDIQDDNSVGDMLIKAENTKRRLSNNASATFTFRYKRKPYTVPISREDFEDLTVDRVDATILLMKKAIKNAVVPLKAEDIDEIVLVGGSSFMPMIKNAVAEAFPKSKIRLDVHKPNRAVAEGAAIFGNMIANQPTKKSGGSDAQQLPSRSYGLRCTINGQPKVFNIITRNDYIGTDKSAEFVTETEGQTQANLDVYENLSHQEEAEVHRSKLITSSALKWNVSVAKGTPIKVHMMLSPEGTLRVYGSCAGHEGTFKIQVDGASKQEVDAAREDINRRTLR